MNRFGWLAILLSVVLGSQWIYRVHGDKPVSPAIPCVALSGADSKISEPGIFRITTQKDWITLWQKHKGVKATGNYDFFYDPQGLPLIDFERFMVVAVLEGKSSNTAGFKAVFQSEDSEKLIFRFEGKGYQTFRVVRELKNEKDLENADMGNPSRAYGFFVLPRSNKPLIVQESYRNIIGNPPEIVERIRFPKF